jgi:hypothetical protein
VYTFYIDVLSVLETASIDMTKKPIALYIDALGNYVSENGNIGKKIYTYTPLGRTRIFGVRASGSGEICSRQTVSKQVLRILSLG